MKYKKTYDGGFWNNITFHRCKEHSGCLKMEATDSYSYERVFFHIWKRTAEVFKYNLEKFLSTLK